LMRLAKDLNLAGLGGHSLFDQCDLRLSHMIDVFVDRVCWFRCFVPSVVNFSLARKLTAQISIPSCLPFKSLKCKYSTKSICSCMRKSNFLDVKKYKNKLELYMFI
jgi:hypothetical protein